MVEPTEKSPKPLAIVGLSFRLPQNAISSEAFWEMIIARRCAMTEFPRDRLNIDAHYRPEMDRLDSLSIRGGHFLEEDISRFDAPFFSITAAEAEAMEPPQRLILETAFHALEDAGIPLQHIAKSKTAVFAGSSGHDWLILQSKDPLRQHKYNITGTTSNMLANRVSWFFNLTGPSATVDTACSSSLMAIDLTCQSIWSGQSTMGLAMGSNLLLAAESTLMMDNLGLLSKNNRCHSFDQCGNGYSRGEGVGVLVIKPLEDAVRDGDTIRAVIRASASNQDGKTPGITQPSAEMQASLIRDTYRQAYLDMGITRYFEAHGTGTAIGDPIEIKAIGSVFRQHRSPAEPLYIGSVKSNIGHLEGASGIAGVIKVILALEKGIIPPNSENLQQLNPRIDDEFWNIQFPKDALTWPTDGLRRASISSFGYGGSNTHIVLDDAYHSLLGNHLDGKHNTTPLLSSVVRSNKSEVNGIAGPKENGVNGTAQLDAPKLLVWSAADEGGVSRLQNTWNSFFSTWSGENKKPFLHNLAYTLTTRRTHLPWRTFAVARPSDNFNYVGERFSSACQSRESPNLAMIFSGQGAQWYAMGRELLHMYPTFLQSIEEAGEYLRNLGCEWSPLEELQKPKAESNVDRTEYSQILCTILQIALVDLLRSFNIVPKAVLGHSSGEVTAAYCARAISRRSAWKVSYYRGNMSSQLEKCAKMNGSMLAVALSEKEVMPYIELASAEFEVPRLTIGCINSPKSVTISGEGVQLDALKARLDKENVFCRRLKVNLAYHSSQMKEIASEYLAALGELEGTNSAYHTRPQMVSSITGDWIDPDEPCQASHWVRNMISPVRFSGGLATLCAASSDTEKVLDGSHRRKYKIDHILEIGPHSVLQGACKDVLKQMNRSSSIKYLSLLVRNMSAVDTAFSVFGDLYAAGYPINLSLLNKDEHTAMALPNLPKYPFNHEKSYWHESRISKGYRLRQYARNDLLGLPEPDQNPLEAQWRNLIRVSEMPWVQDHKINGAILYPGAGMLVMAIEAAKQLSDQGRPISGFNLQNVEFRSAIRVPSGADGIETSFHLRPARNMESKSSARFDFQIFTLANETWTENCSGSIRIVYSDKEEEIDKGLSVELQDSQKNAYAAALAKCKSSTSGEKIYEILNKSGYGYGAAFQLITDLALGKPSAEVTATVRNFSSSSGETIHPTTLDAILQTSIWAAVPSNGEAISTAIPTHINNVWVDSQAIASRNLKTYGSVAEVSQFLGPAASIVALDDNLQKTLVSIEGLHMNVVSSSETTDTTQKSVDSLCHHIEWKPDLKLLSDVEVIDLCITGFVKKDGHEALCSELDFLIAARIAETLSYLSQKGIQVAGSNIKNYHNWLIDRQKLLEEGQLEIEIDGWRKLLNDSDYVQEVHNRAMGTKRGYPYAYLAQNLTKVLTGELNISTFLQTENILDQVYHELVTQSPGFHGLTKYLDLFSHRHPKAKIMEIDGGGGSVTDLIVTSLEANTNQSRCRSLEYTDISSENVAKAQGRFSPEVEGMGFKVMDINRDPADQGFECGSYDMVVISMIFSEVRSAKNRLTNARKLLKPDGKLVLYDGIAPDGRFAFMFGLLEQWWQGQAPYSKFGRCMDQSEWDALLRQTGYSGLDTTLSDSSNKPLPDCKVMISTATENKLISSVSSIEIIFDSAQADQLVLANLIAKQCSLFGCAPVRMVSMTEAKGDQPTEEILRVFILELENLVWSDIQKDLYEQLQALLSSTLRALWINQGGGILPTKPHFRLVEGLFRTLMEEDGRKQLNLLSIEPGDDVNGKSQQIAKLVRLLSSGVATEVDTEYIEQDGILHIPRVVTPVHLNETISQKASTKIQSVQSFHCQEPLKLDPTSPGLITGFNFIEDTSAHKPLEASEIEIDVKCAGVNFRDVLIAVGQLKASHVGSECSGIVRRIGTAVSRFRVGDSVAALHEGCFATSIRVQENGPVVKIPAGVSLEEAAALPVNYATAYVALHNVARIQRGESVLIHSGTGGTGQAAIQIAKNAGATIFATVGSSQKKQFLIDTYQIPESHIFSSRTTLFAQAIKHQTGNKGVDVILNSLAGESLLASWECIAPYGRFLEIGKRDILSNQGLPMSQFLRNVTYSGVDLAAMSVERPEVCSAALDKIFALVQEGKLHPSQPIHQYGVGDIEKGFRVLQGGQHLGKMVLEMRPDDQVTTILQNKPSYSLDPNATFVVCGGLGGLGSNIVHWLADRGARHLLLLSRSGGQDKKSRALIDSLRVRDVQVMAPACDVSDEVPVQNALRECASQMPPIKGCIQAAMVLRDALFENISHQSWHESIAPKVQGSWNLHQYLPRGMDFFIMLSSISGIVGTTGQANYAAGNTFQDALARHRVGLGEKATALDLGVFDFAGAVAENSQLQEMLITNMGLEPVTEPQLHAVLDYYCDPQVRLQSNTDCQVTVGLSPNAAQAPWLKKPMFQHLVAHDLGSARYGTDSVAASLQQVGSLACATAVVTEAIALKLSKALSIAVADFDPSKPLHQYGVDSLVAVELRSWFARELQAEMAVFDILGGATLTSVAQLATSKSKLGKESWS
ncbi:hypothetical protein N7462_006216 [Penicillium macrosclerotiorum]|uniref:uncharacterized protein n=1 Tax=Penicillium macrosclerotiorum TaxID=303699 RepID=UPI0025493F4D|nr:uncharacterized protein N7462_006216 [Penicillium macrosclerotiorum]KAJ5683051.1 hypothetical protein N7462_006216 [Penicillium macrosclerotiorum]